MNELKQVKKPKARTRENEFKRYLRQKYGSEYFIGNTTFSNEDSVSISVDEKIDCTDNSTILIEFDTGNYAKLIVGQYILLNELYQENTSEEVFLVIHANKHYNPERTIKNLKFIKSGLLENKGMNFCALKYEDFIKLCEENELNSLVNVIFDIATEQSNLNYNLLI
ncbi:hypothetical protein CR203_14305 [Salipaludibacillus neizhouensis]|uniref:Uncharacterized protein n=1 Tax=Salipaludibacillus neizhouensis TaxID=885475 RepID=A0A3A9K6H9_9BACI|nr:hypothetical protein [Salipaludibacillus neizhouensis]RKL66470.1 hypothetical protein CR203_14305 [Salipaludibacillus neizhouensis]